VNTAAKRLAYRSMAVASKYLSLCTVQTVLRRFLEYGFAVATSGESAGSWLCNSESVPAFCKCYWLFPCTWLYRDGDGCLLQSQHVIGYNTEKCYEYRQLCIFYTVQQRQFSLYFIECKLHGKNVSSESCGSLERELTNNLEVWQNSYIWERHWHSRQAVYV